MTAIVLLSPAGHMLPPSLLVADVSMQQWVNVMEVKRKTCDHMSVLIDLVHRHSREVCLLLILFRSFVIEVSFEIYFVLVECGFLSFHGDLRPRWLCYGFRRDARGPRRLGNGSLGYISGNWCQIFLKKKTIMKNAQSCFQLLRCVDVGCLKAACVLAESKMIFLSPFFLGISLESILNGYSSS